MKRFSSVAFLFAVVAMLFALNSKSYAGNHCQTVTSVGVPVAVSQVSYVPVQVGAPQYQQMPVGVGAGVCQTATSVTTGVPLAVGTSYGTAYNQPTLAFAQIRTYNPTIVAVPVVAVQQHRQQFVGVGNGGHNYGNQVGFAQQRRNVGFGRGGRVGSGGGGNAANFFNTVLDPQFLGGVGGAAAGVALAGPGAGVGGAAIGSAVGQFIGRGLNLGR
jgi:hypothetical protein